MNSDSDFLSGCYKMTKPNAQEQQIMVYCAADSIGCYKMMTPKTKQRKMASCAVEETDLERASRFMDQVKQTDKYHSFLAMLRECHDGKISAQCSFFKLQNLFAAHPDLLSGIEIFRPEFAREIAIPAPPAPQEKRTESEQPELEPQSPQRDSTGIEYVNKVRERFGANSNTYNEFLDAIVKHNGHVNSDKTTLNLCLKMVDLLFGHADLIHGFQRFFRCCEGEIWRMVKKDIAFAIDDQMGEIEVMLSRLRSSIECAEYAQRLASPELMSKFVAENFVGIKLMAIKKVYGEELSEEVIELLKKDPGKGLPAIMEALREKERAVSIVRSEAHQFYKQFRALDTKKRGVKRKSRG